MSTPKTVARRTLAATTFTIGLTAALGSIAHATGNGHTPVTLCHNGHTITIDDSAMYAHLKHGDTLGPCTPEPTEDPCPTPTSTPTPTTSPTATPSPSSTPSPESTVAPSPQPTESLPTGSPATPSPTTPPTPEPSETAPTPSTSSTDATPTAASAPTTPATGAPATERTEVPAATELAATGPSGAHGFAIVLVLMVTGAVCIGIRGRRGA